MPKIKQSKDVTFNPAEEAENEAVAEVVTENAEAEEKANEAEVKIVNPLKEKMVKIRLREKHFCNIGGTPYHFKKNEVYTVPLNVKRVLMEADLLTSV
jgi:hypothetical protein